MLTRGTSSTFGLHVYGLAAVALGIIGLVWGDFAAVWQPVAPDVPWRTPLAYFVAACFLAAGVAIQFRGTARAGTGAVTALYLIFAAIWSIRVASYPRMIGTWTGFAEQMALVAAGIIACAGTNTTARIARVLFGMCAITFGLAHFLALKETAGMVPHWVPPGQRFWAMATGVAHLLAGFAIVSGIQALPAARLFTAMLIGFGALVWAPSLAAHPADHTVWAGNAINLAIAGAAWVVADSIGAPNRLLRLRN